MLLFDCCAAAADLQQPPPQLFSDPQQAVKDVVSAYTAEQGFKEISVEVGFRKHTHDNTEQLPSIGSQVTAAFEATGNKTRLHSHGWHANSQLPWSCYCTRNDIHM